LTVILGGVSSLAGCQLIGDFDEPRLVLAQSEQPAQPALRFVGRASYTCAWVEGGRAKCWGRHPSSAGGFEADVPAYIREQNGTPLTGIAEIALGGEHACARLDDGHVTCWGSNSFGQLGIPFGSDDDQSPFPVFVEDKASLDGRLTGVASVALGGRHTCARLNDGNGNVMCWGSNARGQLGSTKAKGEATYEPTFAEERIHGRDLSNVVEIALGNEHSCARLDDERITCWGSNEHGQLGRSGDDASAGPLLELEGVKEISLVGDRSYARLANWHVRCWGLGYGFSPTSGTDQHCDEDDPWSNPVELDRGDSWYTCERSPENDVDCWRRSSGQKGGKGPTDGRRDVALLSTLRGLESSDRNPDPEPVTNKNGTPLAGVVELVLGNKHGCARRGADRIACWGSNALGQLGNPTSAGEPKPIAYPLPVEGLTIVRRP
jgi:alpha-tubulin suppressor-like RCC1 family protein